MEFCQAYEIPYQELTSSVPLHSFKKLTAVHKRIYDCQVRLVFCTPERIVKNKEFVRLIDQMYKEDKIARFVLDEVHCVKNWGDDFRVAYKHLDRLKAKYPTVPILGLTATATVNVRK